jgi:hypothetical protein
MQQGPGSGTKILMFLASAKAGRRGTVPNAAIGSLSKIHLMAIKINSREPIFGRV